MGFCSEAASAVSRVHPAAAFPVPNVKQLSAGVSPADSCPPTAHSGTQLQKSCVTEDVSRALRAIYRTFSLTADYVHKRISEPELDFLSLTTSSSPLLLILLKNMTCALSDFSRVTRGYWRQNVKGLEAQFRRERLLDSPHHHIFHNLLEFTLPCKLLYSSLVWVRVTFKIH